MKTNSTYRVSQNSLVCKPTGGDASVRDAKNWMGAWDSKAKNCPPDRDNLLISDAEERSVYTIYGNFLMRIPFKSESSETRKLLERENSPKLERLVNHFVRFVFGDFDEQRNTTVHRNEFFGFKPS